MTATVNHRRPSLDTTRIESPSPLSGEDWTKLGGLANWCNGHGGMLIPWCAIGRTLTSASATFHFYVGPKSRAVQRVWHVSLTATEGTTADIKPGGGATETVALIASGGGASSTTGGGALTQSYRFVESLSAKTNTAGDTTLTVTTSGGKTAYISGCSMYEETRGDLDLDTTDYGVDLASTHARQPIADFANRSTCGVANAYKNLDARRAGIFHWSTLTTDPLDVTQVGYTDLFPLYPPALGAVAGTGTTSTTFTVAAYAKVDSGTGKIKFISTNNGSSVEVDVTGTSFGWVTGTLTIDAEDLSIADGRRGNAWETIQIQGKKNTANTLSVAALSVIRTTTPI